MSKQNKLAKFTQWSERERQESERIFKLLIELAAERASLKPFWEIVTKDPEMSDQQKLYWVALCVEDLWNGVKQGMEWATAYRYALAERFVMDAFPGKKFADLPLPTRLIVMQGIDAKAGVDHDKISAELQNWPEILVKYFKPHPDSELNKPT